MATKYELRTFDDIIRFVLEELGEKYSNTNTLNKIKRDLNAIYLNEIVPDHDWPWLKRTVEAQTEAYFNTGKASVTANSSTITLTEAPAKSYKGYFFASKGYNEVYRVAHHTSGSSTLTLESPYTGTTSGSADFTIWQDFVALPADCIETIQVTHAHLPYPLEAKGNQDFERMRSGALRASGRPKSYTTGEKQYPEPYELVDDLPATLTRSSSGRIRTIVFNGSLGSETLLISPGDKIEISTASASAYNGEVVIAEVSTTNVENDTIRYTSDEVLNQSSTSDTSITVKKAVSDSYHFAYRPLYLHPALLDTRTTLKVSYLIEPQPLVETTDEPLIPVQDRIVLAYGVLSRQWVKARDEETSVRNEMLFRQKLAKMAGRIEDAQDLPRIRPSASYYNAKRRRPAPGFPGYSNDGFPYGSASSKVTGTASRVAVFDASGELVSDSNVTTTELGYLDGTTSNVQDQLDAKLGSLGNSTDEALVRWDGSTGGVLQDSAFSVNDDGDLSGTGSIQVDNLKLDGNSITSTDSDGNINLTPDGTGLVVSANARVSNLSTGVVHADAEGDLSSSPIVNTDVDDAAAIAYSKLNLSDSIVDADVAPGAAVALDKLAATTVDRALQSSASGVIEPSSVTSTELGYVSGVTSSIQTQIDAQIPKSMVTTKGDLLVATGNAAPARFPVGSDGQVIVGDSTQTAGMKWAAAPSGNINFISAIDRDAESTTHNYITYDDQSGTDPSKPTDGTGTDVAITVSFDRTTTAGELIRGAGTYKLSKTAANSKGQGFSVPFSIDPGYYESPKMMTVKLRYQASANFDYGSGTVSDPSDLVFYVYDITNGGDPIQLSPFVLDGSGEFVSQFQPAYNSGSYRLIGHIATTNALAWDFFFDDVEVGPSAVVRGVPKYSLGALPTTGTWVSGNETYSFVYERDGEYLVADGHVSLSGAPTSTTFYVNLPSGLTINTDASKLPTTTHANLGRATWYDSANVATQGGAVIYSNTTRVQPVLQRLASASNHDLAPATATVPKTWVSGDKISISYRVPIQGWFSNTVMSSDADTRVVAARYTCTSSGVSVSATQPLNYSTMDFDTHGCVTTGSGWKFTAKIPGIYAVYSSAHLTDAKNTRVYKNGVGHSSLDAISAVGQGGAPALVQLNVGDYIDMRTTSAVATTTDVADGAANWIAIYRLSGPATIAASEKVYAEYTTAAGQAIGTSLTDAVFGTKVEDSHGAFNASTGVFTAPRPDVYEFHARTEITNTNLTTSHHYTSAIVTSTGKTRYFSRSLGTGVNVPHASAGSVSIKLNAGETAKLQAISSVATTLQTSASLNYITITSQGGV